MLPVLEELTRLQKLAIRHTTACGAGELVWHSWGEPREGQVPVVLFHGGSGSWTHWVRNIQALVDAGRQVWAPDLPGFGDSSVPPDGTDADAMVAPLYAGWQQLLGSTPCDLIGFSFGGMTAGLLAAAHHDVALRLVLVGAPAMGVVPQRQFELKGWRHLTDIQEQEAVHRYNLAALMLFRAESIDDAALQIHMGNVHRDRLPRRRLAHTDILARSLPNIVCPVFAIYGEHDSLYKSWIAALEGVFRQVTPHFMGMRLLANSGHWVQYESAPAFDAALAEVLATPLSTAAAASTRTVAAL